MSWRLARAVRLAFVSAFVAEGMVSGVTNANAQVAPSTPAKPGSTAPASAGATGATGAGGMVAPPGAAPVVVAKVHLGNATRAAQKKDWTTASVEYEAANKALPSEDALEGLADAQYQLKQDGEAYASYEEYLKTYGRKAGDGKRSLAEARIKELTARTGLLVIVTTEPGATISVDDKPVGTSPLAVPLRASAGPHRVRVTKDGFAPFDQAPSVTPGSMATVQAKLEVLSSKGRVSVKEKTGKPIRVIVDGVDMGDAPWSGELEAGQHDIVGKSPSFAAAPEKVTVERGKTQDVELVASSTTGTLKVSTNDGKGVIYLDGKVVGEGTFGADVPAGTHALRVTRDGYDPYEESIDLHDKENKSVSVTMKLSSTIETGPVLKDQRRLEGIYGGVGLMMTFLPGGMKHSMQKTCEASDKPVELASCDGTDGGLGGGITGFVGYHWDPVGVELYFGAQYDQTSPKLDWNASSVDPGVGPDPARTEDFSVRRFGGFAVARVRLSLPIGEKFRFSAAAGVGLSYRSMLLERDTTAKANAQFRDVFVPGAEGYLSPVLSVEPTIMYRVTPTTALAVGLSMLVESPRAFDNIPRTAQDGSRSVGPSGLTTPSYELATGTQFFIGPYIGVMFGP